MAPVAPVEPGEPAPPADPAAPPVIIMPAPPAPEADNDAPAFGDVAGTGLALPSNALRKVAERLMRGKNVGWIGIHIGADNAQRSGVPVMSVIAKSPADSAGLLPNDLIVAVNGKPIRIGDDLRAVTKAMRVGDVLSVEVIRGGTRRALRITIQARPASDPRVGPAKTGSASESVCAS